MEHDFKETKLSDFYCEFRTPVQQYTPDPKVLVYNTIFKPL
jgi:hypothetical protein